MFVCLGWGSLIWDPRELPVCSEWSSDGPLLPVEFARQSSDGRITLVVTSGAKHIPVCWAKLDLSSVGAAKRSLAKREGVSERFVSQSIGFWTKNGASNHEEANPVGEWARERGFQGVVWTALKPKFDTAYITPTADQVVEYLRGLSGEQLRRAEEYICKAPTQIKTPYRQEIERALGWVPIGEAS